MVWPFFLLAAQQPCYPQQERQKLAGRTNCPNNDEWLNSFSERVSAPANIVVVGCNKGVDAVRLFSQYDTRREPYRLGHWKKALRGELQGRGACGQVSGATELTKPPQWLRPNQVSNVYCIEPMPANVRLLRRVAQSTRMPPQFHIMPYALGTSLSPRQQPFPDGRAGTENRGLQDRKSEGTVQVNTSTVNELFGNITVDMLLVDTEGNDPLVLLGASRVLQTVSYLEFENHGVGGYFVFVLDNQPSI